MFIIFSSIICASLVQHDGIASGTIGRIVKNVPSPTGMKRQSPALAVGLLSKRHVECALEQPDILGHALAGRVGRELTRADAGNETSTISTSDQYGAARMARRT